MIILLLPIPVILLRQDRERRLERHLPQRTVPLEDVFIELTGRSVRE